MLRICLRKQQMGGSIKNNKLNEKAILDETMSTFTYPGGQDGVLMSIELLGVHDTGDGEHHAENDPDGAVHRLLRMPDEGS